MRPHLPLLDAFPKEKKVKDSSCCSDLQHELQLLPKYIENEIQFSETRNVSKNVTHKVWNKKAFHAMPRGMSLSKDWKSILWQSITSKISPIGTIIQTQFEILESNVLQIFIKLFWYFSDMRILRNRHLKMLNIYLKLQFTNYPLSQSTTVYLKLFNKYF